MIQFSMNSNYYAILMAGGVGSRFWPVSTTEFPKQFHDMLGSNRFHQTSLQPSTSYRFRRTRISDYLHAQLVSEITATADVH